MKDIIANRIDEFKVKTLVGFTVVVCFMGYLHSWLAFQFLDSNISGYCLLILPSLALLTLIIQRYNYNFAANYMTMMLFISLCIVANSGELLSSAGAWWYPAVPIAGFLLINIKVGLAWFILTIIAITSTFLNNNHIVNIDRVTVPMGCRLSDLNKSPHRRENRPAQTTGRAE